MLYFIRHAESVFNYEADEKLRDEMQKKGLVFSKKSAQYQTLKFDPKYADCGLTEKGKMQCLQAKESIKDVDIQLVLVSPMRRALETCDIIFRDHPKKPKIIVDPNVRQIFSSSCDIGTRLRESMIDFPYFDYSQIKEVDFWYIDSIKNEQIREKLLIELENQTKMNKIQRKEGSSQMVNKLAFQIMLQYLKQAYGKIDQYSHSNFEGQKMKLKKLAQQHKRVAVVSHHDNIITYTKRPTKNCQVLAFPAEHL